MFNEAPARLHSPPHFLLELWLALLGLVVFGTYVSLDQGLIQAMIVADRSRICIVIVVMYLIGAGHTFVRTLLLSREIARADRLARDLEQNRLGTLRVAGGRLSTVAGAPIEHGFAANFLADFLALPSAAARAAGANEGNSDLLDAYASRLRRNHEFGWYYIDAMLKVGFLGTLVGFILMLGSVAESGTVDASTMQHVLQQMSVGMSTALYTTLASIVGGILLSIPYYVLDRGLERLLETTIYLKEILLPRHGTAAAEV